MPALPVAAAPAIEQPKVQPVTRTQIAPETPGDLRYRNRRLLVLYFDMTSMPVPDQLRAAAAAQKFIRTQMTPADLVAMMSYSSGAVKVLEDFTDDRDRLLNSLEKMILAEQGLDEDADDDSSADTGAAFGQDDSEFNIFNTDRQLSAIQTAATMLGQLNEKKALIYFASGLRLNGVDNQAQLRATVNAAIRANVALFTIDARGLVAQAPLGDATHGSPGGLGDVYRRLGDGDDERVPALAGHALCAGRGYRRQGAARLQRSDRGDRPGPEGDFRLLHHRLLHHQHDARWQVPAHQHIGEGRASPSWITARAISRARNSVSSRPPIRNDSSKTP